MKRSARDHVQEWTIMTLGQTATFWFPERWRRRLRTPATARERLRWFPVHTLLIFGTGILAARARRAETARRERLRVEFGREPTDEEMRTARLADMGIELPPR